MEERIKFKNILDEIEEKAKTQDGKITVSQIQTYFAQMDLEETQRKLVYDFIISRNITVTGYDCLEEAEVKRQELTKEEKDFLNDYLESLENIKTFSKEEENHLYSLILQKDAMAKSQLTEGMLMMAVNIAKEYGGRGVLIGDLIQEGNIGLLLGVDQLEDQKDIKNFQEVKAYLEKQIRESMIAAIEEQADIKQSGVRMLEKINYINESLKDLKEDLGRNVTIEEIAEYTKKTEEEIRDVLRLAIDEISL